MSNYLIGRYLGASAIKAHDKGNSRDFWIDTTEDGFKLNTPQLGLWGDKCEIVDRFKTGDEVKVYFNVRGNKYKNKATGKDSVFTALQAWKIELNEQAPPATAIPAPATTSEIEVPDDLPF